MKYSELLFPAYETSAEDPMAEAINGALPFRIKADWPENWTITTDGGNHNWPAGEVYTPYYIYDGDTPVGYVGFNVFQPFCDEMDYENGYKQAWSQLRNSSMYMWDPFTPLLNGFTNQIGTVEIDYVDYTQIENHDSLATVPHIQTNGIMAYDINLNSWVGIAFMPGAVDADLLRTLAMSFRISAM